jgi:hypothetical protein
MVVRSIFAQIFDFSITYSPNKVVDDSQAMSIPLVVTPGSL